MNVNLKSLIAKLNPFCRNALEAAAGLCLTRTHYDVEIEHLLTKLNEAADSDLQRIYKHYEIDPGRLSGDLTRAVDRFKTGNARTPALSPRIQRCIADAWEFASIDFGTPLVRSGHLLLALLADEDFARMLRDTSKLFGNIPVEDLHRHFAKLTAQTAEDDVAAQPSLLATDDNESRQQIQGRTPALDQFTIDLTLRARAGQIDPVLGRDLEIRQMVDILTRRRQNNPILTGEAGVGKTAVVEGLALRIAAGDVPEPLLKVALKSLDLTLLQAGAGIKGEFENRLKSVIEEVKGASQPIVLFIDEAHTLIGAGNQAGQGDAANILKPALARGELRTIAATTWSEYKKFFEKDAALSRRFQVVKVEEPTEEQAIDMLRGLAGTLEQHHNVRILDEAIDAAARLSHRYISGRQLPDKAVSVLDTASARVALGQTTIPPALEDCRRLINLAETEIGILERETITGTNFRERLENLSKRKEELQARENDLQKQWTAEKKCVDELRSVRHRLEAHSIAEKAPANVEHRLSSEEVAKLQEELTRLGQELAELQGNTPLIQVCVDGPAVAEVVSAWTGIPVGKVVKDEIQTVMTLKDRLAERVIGQAHALDAISQRIRTSRAKLEDPRRPIGVFMLVGPSGVGKTETALALADTLFGGERNLVIINMSEYQEAHTVSGLKGSPPGYVGYGEGGRLTEAVRRKPYSVVLLDEIEKAHSDVMELFYQVFDKGMLEDAEGREVDFKNTIILMTSNVGTDTLMHPYTDSGTKLSPEELAEALRPDLLAVFKPAFLGRAIIVPYYPIADDIMRRIIELQLGRIERRVLENHRAKFTYDTLLIDEVARRCTEVESGARNVDHILTRSLLPEMSGEFLARMANGEPISHVHVKIGSDGNFQYEIS